MVAHVSPGGKGTYSLRGSDRILSRTQMPQINASRPLKLWFLTDDDDEKSKLKMMKREEIPLSLPVTDLQPQPTP